MWLLLLMLHGILHLSFWVSPDACITVVKISYTHVNKLVYEDRYAEWSGQLPIAPYKLTKYLSCAY